MSIPVFDIASTASNASNVTSLSWSHNFGALTNGAIVVGVYLNVNATHNTTLSTATCGGVAMTMVKYQATDDGDLFMFVLAMGTVSSGNQTISLAWTNSAAVAASASSYSTVNQSTPYANFIGTKVSSSTSITQSPTTTTNDMAVDVTGDWNFADNAITKGASQTQRSNFSVGGGTFYLSTSERAGAAGSVSMSWSDTSAGSIGQITGILQGTTDLFNPTRWDSNGQMGILIAQ